MSRTIAAFATAPGAAGLSVMRIAGPDAAKIAGRVFTFGKLGADSGKQKKKKNRTPASLRGYQAAFGYVHEADRPDRPIDQCILTRFRKPYSYTGEEQVELSVHGGAASRRALLQAVLEAGAVPAEAGEFTKLAFLNGKMDLAQAEAVMDIIQADTARQRELALRQLEGAAGNYIAQIREDIYALLAALEVEIEYPEYEDFSVSAEASAAALDAIIEKLERLERRNDEGRIIREGMQLVLLGEPNVGKSSLLNALAGEDRAIVTAVPGTTRDTLELHLDMAGIPLYIYDTAGIRESEDYVEKIGVERSRAQREKADLLLIVTEAGGLHDLQEQIEAVLGESRKPFLLLYNKTDLQPEAMPEEKRRLAEAAIQERFPNCRRFLPLSAKTSKGLPELREAIRDFYESLSAGPAADFALSSLRQQKLLSEALAHFKQLRKDLTTLPSDILAAGIRQGMELLAEITGESVSEEMIEEIFSRFCVGK